MLTFGKSGAVPIAHNHACNALSTAELHRLWLERVEQRVAVFDPRDVIGGETTLALGRFRRIYRDIQACVLTVNRDAQRPFAGTYLVAQLWHYLVPDKRLQLVAGRQPQYGPGSSPGSMVHRLDAQIHAADRQSQFSLFFLNKRAQLEKRIAIIDPLV